jgi:transcriptional regulator with PAS, ATPase and Fis domain
MLEVFDAVKKVAPTDATVLILGESGTGKELVARYVHHLSPRNERLFTAVNCSVLRDTFLESELFGHVRGAYTGAVSSKKGLLELAHGGSFFLDEVAEVSVPVQAKLLRVLEERSFMRLGGTETINVDVRLIAATNKNLEEYVRDGKFRDDLYYRINAFTITIPPLRERREDIPLLCYHFLKKHCRKMGRRIHEIDSGAMDALMNHDWPGNVRELDKAIERAVILETGEIITAEDLPGRVSSSTAPKASQVTTLPYREAKRNLTEAFDREYVEGVLKDSEGNVTKAAERAGMDRRNFQRLMKHAGISPQ